MNIQSIIVLSIVFVWIFLAIRHTRKNGVCSCGGSCNGDCSHCSGCSHCKVNDEKRG